MTNFNDLTPEQLRELEEQCLKSLDNFGPPQDMWYEEYGQIFKDGQPTESGIRWYKEVILKEK
jgi:hypothetical protein